MPVGATIAVGSAAVGAYTTDRASKRAANAQRDAANQASDTQLEMYYQTRADQAPWMQTGEQALYQLADLNGTSRPVVIDNETGEVLEYSTPDSSSALKMLEASPDYQFAYDQGNKAVMANLSARGLSTGDAMDSGNAMKELTRYGQGMATQQLSNYRNSLAALAGVGQASTNFVNQVGNNTASNVGRNQMAAGDAMATSYMQRAGNVNNFLNQATGLASLGMGGSPAGDPYYASRPQGAVGPLQYNGTY